MKKIGFFGGGIALYIQCKNEFTEDFMFIFLISLFFYSIFFVFLINRQFLFQEIKKEIEECKELFHKETFSMKATIITLIIIFCLVCADTGIWIKSYYFEEYFGSLIYAFLSVVAFFFSIIAWAHIFLFSFGIIIIINGANDSRV